jgi:hypothetical protein
MYVSPAFGFVDPGLPRFLAKVRRGGPLLYLFDIGPNQSDIKTHRNLNVWDCQPLLQLSCKVRSKRTVFLRKVIAPGLVLI